MQFWPGKIVLLQVWMDLEIISKLQGSEAEHNRSDLLLHYCNGVFLCIVLLMIVKETE